MLQGRIRWMGISGRDTPAKWMMRYVIWYEQKDRNLEDLPLVCICSRNIDVGVEVYWQYKRSCGIASPSHPETSEWSIVAKRPSEAGHERIILAASNDTTEKLLCRGSHAEQANNKAQANEYWPPLREPSEQLDVPRKEKFPQCHRIHEHWKGYRRDDRSPWEDE